MAEPTAPSKSPYGAACNGCGLCCLAEPCQIATDLMGWVHPCPAIEFENGRFWCGMARNPSRYVAGHFPAADQRKVDCFIGSMVESLLGIGRGCDSEIEGEEDRGG